MIDTNAMRKDWTDRETGEIACDIAALCDEVDRLRAELHRWQHGEQIESDYACRPALELQAEVDRLRAMIPKSVSGT